MSVAYLDSSWWLGIAFDERDSRAKLTRLNDFEEVFSANLLEAEVRAAFRREGADFDPADLRFISWILPDQALSQEIGRVLDAGYLRGADLWHLAVALYLSPNPAELVFLTADGKQAEIAETLGFAGV